MNKKIIKQIIPPILFDAARGLLQKPIFSGQYASFAEAAEHCQGNYEADAIIDAYAASYQAQMEDPSRGLSDPDFAGRFSQFMAGLSLAMADNDGTVRVLDFGGSNGAYYEAARHLFPQIHFEWDIIETARAVAAAHLFGADDAKRYYPEIGAVAGRSYDLCFASGSIQYTPHPLDIMRQLLALDCRHYMVTRFSLADFLVTDTVMIQNVPKVIYDASYPVWFFSPKWIEHFKEWGCDILLQADVPMDKVTVEGHTFCDKMFLLMKRTQVI